MDWSEISAPISFNAAKATDEIAGLTADDCRDFSEYGFVCGRDRISSAVIDRLLADLQWLTQPGHEGEHLWHEYHTNESTTKDKTLFHALGAW